ncbi:MarR family transcriptional regulator [Elizabethkingia sp. HX WHF]|uniref:MarR family transcriptional regulator n=1 Tax=Elizabethkingia bruuniana TaxID=1756149 RepID=A0A7T7UWV2_9FLAO|nr:MULTISPECIES: MarR family transcriptional regulator [Elizabethkingia]ATL43322.1 MarR family transcriptional regulator [Elizabethkingia miricola]AQX84182.1 MarR family transcriptional regulator [Elizabethkingia bruuniana]KGO10128.1 MarR family transcriptional regulator [Elizabethkingia miricola]KUY28359.1 MarR family transcriptional regulator [Elizabethkingia bruuniana]MCL1638607.1 MarR family transcriptional regulator [Elizabethkingia bruuniana]
MKNKDNTFSVERPEDSTGFLLWQVTNLWQREIKKALEKYELTHAQFVLLASTHWLTLQNQDVTQILLSNHTKIDPMTTSTVLRTLQTKGFIRRAEHRTDTRAKTVELTVAGLKNIKQAVVAVEEFDKQFFGLLDGKANDFNSKLIALLGNKNNI